jgi:hypothetical protein
MAYKQIVFINWEEFLMEDNNQKMDGKKYHAILGPILAVILVILIGICIYLGYKTLSGGVSAVLPSGDGGAVPNMQSGDKGTDDGGNPVSQGEAKNDGQTAEGDYSNPVTYLPQINMKYTFETRELEGSVGSTDITVGKLPDYALLTTVEVVPDSDAIAAHYLEDPKGITNLFDGDSEDKASLWLPNNLKVGDTWNTEFSSVEILKTGESVDLGFKKFDNCVVLQVDYPESEETCTEYLAPGMGTILIYNNAMQDPVLKLVSIKELSESETNGILNSYVQKGESSGN